MLTDKMLRRVVPAISAAAPHRDRGHIDGCDGAGAQEQYFGIPSSRVGPYSAMGTGYYGGIIDYLNYVNMKGGVNGVKLTYDECETEYNAARTVECYQRLLNKGDQKMVVFDTLGTPAPMP
jgi:branched-chain amino acid transport system substrate-binding protein